MAGALKDVVKPVTAGGNKTVRQVIMVIIFIIVIYVIYKIYLAAKIAGEAGGEIIGAAIIEHDTGVQAARQKICKIVAGDCENAIYRVPFFGGKLWAKDDEIVNALNRLISPAEAALTCTFFRQISGDSLKSVVEGGLFVESNRKRITFRDSLT